MNTVMMTDYKIDDGSHDQEVTNCDDDYDAHYNDQYHDNDYNND